MFDGQVEENQADQDLVQLIPQDAWGECQDGNATLATHFNCVDPRRREQKFELMNSKGFWKLEESK